MKSLKLIESIEEDPEYLIYRGITKQKMFERTHRLIQFTNNLTHECINNYSICIKGSYGTLAPNIYSDLDIVLISNTFYDIREFDWLVNYGSMNGYEISIFTYMICPNHAQHLLH